MNPIEFKEMTTPPNPEVDPELQKKVQQKCPGAPPLLGLPSFVSNDEFLSCWKLSFTEKISALFFGKIWLLVHAPIGEHPPIGMQCRNSFNRKKEEGK